MNEWQYILRRHVFRHRATGQEISYDEMVAVRDGYIIARQLIAQAVATRYATGEIGLNEFARLFRAISAETMAGLAMFGAGGRERFMQLPNAIRTLEELLLAQMPYADNFLDEIAAAERAGTPMSQAAIEQRASLYQGAAVEAFERSNADDWSIDLPYFPADGTDCLTQCRCSWDIETVIEGDDEVTYATWQTEGDDDVCQTCEERGNDWQHREVRRSALTAEQRRTLEPAEMIG